MGFNKGVAMATDAKSREFKREAVLYVEDPAGKQDAFVPTEPLNPCELEIDLFCKGIRVDDSCTIGEVGRPLVRTRAGLGSGLEVIIPGPLKDIWANIPVEEEFAQRSCYRIVRDGDDFEIVDNRQGFRYPVRL